MTTGEVALSILMVCTSGTALGLAVVSFTRSRGRESVRIFGRVVHHPRLFAAAAVCGGLFGLLAETLEHAPDGWEGLSALSTLESALGLASVVLLFAYLGRELRTR